MKFEIKKKRLEKSENKKKTSPECDGNILPHSVEIRVVEYVQLAVC